MQSKHTPHVLFVALLGAAIILTGCSTPPAEDVRSAPIASAETRVEEPTSVAPVRVAVVGDSITSWDPPYAGDPGQSWVFTATSNQMPLVGGWARPGAPIADIEAHLDPVEADVFVMMVGTNDLRIPSVRKKPTPLVDRFAAMDRMIAEVGATHTIVLAVPPFGLDYSESTAWNAQLEQYAAERGLVFTDPWAQVRDARGEWLPGTERGDLVHPTPATATLVGTWVAMSIHNVMSAAKTLPVR